MSWQSHSTVRSEANITAAVATRPTLVGLFSPDRSLVGPPRVLRDGSWSIGRSPGDRVLAIKDARVSRQHARISVTEQGSQLLIEDVSANGTFVDGRRVEKHELKDGEVIRVGDTMLLVRYVPSQARDAFVEGLSGVAPSICQLRSDLLQVARESDSVLVLGESGTGKELVAHGIHRESGRQGAFVPVNCAAIPEAMAESLLFGHVAGAFEGARSVHEGYFRAAHGGTLFLDAIGDLPASVQPKLLRALESGVVLPIGASHPIACDVRVVSATHRDLAADVASERFRGDLYARISHLILRTPALRERREDILPLVRAGTCSELEDLPPNVAEALLVDPWPYNVRQLLAVQKRMRIHGAREGSADLWLFSAECQKVRTGSSLAPRATVPAYDDAAITRDLPPTRSEVVAAVERYKGNIVRTAEALRRSRKQVYRYLDMYGIDLKAERER